MLIPLECEFFSLRGVALLLDTIDKVRERLNFDLELEGILATMYDSRTTHCRQVLQRVVEAFGDKVYQTVITKTVKFPESTVAGAPITSLDPACSGARNYRQLAREVIAAHAERQAGCTSADPPYNVHRVSVSTEAADARPASDPEVEPVVAVPAGPDEATGFQVRLTNFTGPFDLLLQLIGKHKLDVTEVALHKVTDEFIAYIRAMGDDWDLDEVSEFLVVASTLLDLKAARLLPSASVEDEEDLALLEARDLLFARLLQYKAYKEAARADAARDDRRASLSAGGHARAAVRRSAARPGARHRPGAPGPAGGQGDDARRPSPMVSIDHIHMVRVSVREHAAILREKLIGRGYRDVSRSVRRLPVDTGGGRPVPGAARALPRGFGELRPGRRRWAS